MNVQLLDAKHSLEVAVASLRGAGGPGLCRSVKMLGRALARIRSTLQPPICLVVARPPRLRVIRTAKPKISTHVEKLIKIVDEVPEITVVRLKRPRAEEPESVQSSSWDPEPLDEQLEASRCRALLLEIVRRAVYDWVLYRQHDRLELKAIASDAYTWLFEEEPGHPAARRRQREGRGLTSLIAICEVLDLEPEQVRRRAKNMDVRAILTAGRPPEVRRRREVADDSDYQEHGVTGGLDVQGIGDDPGSSYYENQYFVSTSM